MDREKVIKAWEIFRDVNPYKICSGREFRAIREPKYCMGQMIEDTIALLKEQEAVEPSFKQGENGIFVWCCGSCGAYMYHIYDGIDKAKEYAKYCRQCGKKVKWDA